MTGAGRVRLLLRYRIRLANVKKIAEMDIGQAIAVKEREVIAVEGIEGTRI